MNSLRLVVFCLLWSTTTGLTAPGSTTPKTLADLNLVTRHWGSDAGLRAIRTDAVTQTADGYIWVGNSAGLHRFNGKEFTHFDPQSVEGFGDRYISFLCRDQSGFLWLGSTEGKLAYYRDEKFTPVGDDNKRGHIQALTPHPEGGVIACYRKDSTLSVDHFSTNGITQLLAATPFRSRIKELHVSKDDRIWVTHTDGRLGEISEGKHSLFPTMAGGNVGGLVQRMNGTLIAFAREGILAYEHGKWSLHQKFPSPLPPNTRISEACEDGSQRLWFGSQSTGYWIWSDEQRLLAIAQGRNSLPSPTTSIFADDNHNIWITSFSGLYQARFSPFVNWPPPVSTATPHVISLAQSPQGTIWLTSFGVICRMKPGDAFPTYFSSFPEDQLFSIFPAADGGFWTRGRGGDFAKWDHSRKERVKFPIDDVHLGSMLIDVGQFAWVTTSTGLIQYNYKTVPPSIRQVSPSTGLPSGPYSILKQSDNGTLLTVSLHKGVFRNNPGATNWIRVTPQGDRQATTFKSLDLDAENRIWAISPKHTMISCYTSSTNYQRSYHSLKLGKLVSLVADNARGLWFSSHADGVFRVDRDTLYDWVQGNAEILYVDHFDQKNGLGSKGGSYLESGMIKSGDGRIWVATERGLSSIHPTLWHQERDRGNAPKIHISRCHIDEQPVDHTQPITLPKHAVRLAIEYEGLSFGFPDETRYRYRINGLHSRWINAGNETIAQFQSLPPGDYRFEVTAAVRNGAWHATPASLSFTVTPLWWQRTSTQSAAIGIAVLGIVLFFMLRIKALKAHKELQSAFSEQLIASQEKERKRIAGELHDNLGQDLLVIKSRLDLRSMKEPGMGSNTEMFFNFAGQMSKVIKKVREISHNLHPPHLERLGLTAALQAMVDEVSNATQIPITHDIDDMKGRFTPAGEIGLFRIAQEALNNVVKHSDASGAQVTLKHNDLTATLTVRDNGRGFDTAFLRKPDRPVGLGLAGIKERANLLGGTFKPESSPGGGTVITVEVPILTVHAN